MKSRREFLKLTATAMFGSTIGLYAANANAKDDVSGARPLDHEYQGSDLDGWEVIVGDGNDTLPGEPPVSLDDIETINYGTYSELRANIQERGIQAHNLTFYKKIDDQAIESIHVCEYQFKLPFMPSVNNQDFNGQTVEGGFNIWDGATTRANYSVLFQWMVTPYPNAFWDLGDIRCWRPKFVDDPEPWQKVGTLTPDTDWHTLRIVADFQRGTSRMTIDELIFPSCLVKTAGPPDWGTEIAAWIAAEIISVNPHDPEPDRGFLHKSHFRNWSWRWQSYNACTSTFLPMIRR
jgi:hypothetical protein